MDKLNELFFFDHDKLNRQVDQYKAKWQAAKPFPHIVIDNFLPEAVIEQLAAETEGLSTELDWYETFNGSRFNKKSTEHERDLGPMLRHMIGRLNSSDFIRFIEKVTGIDHVLPDPHVFGGGVHLSGQGGFLKVHVDNNWDPKLLLHRRINLILYLNKEWLQDWGGALELWDKAMEKCAAPIAPIWNRLVLFYNGPESLHGHPDPMQCPAGVLRKSLALYYYTATRPEHELRFPHTTKYKARKGEQFRKRKLGKRVLDMLVPPIVSHLLGYMRAKKRNQQHDKK